MSTFRRPLPADTLADMAAWLHGEVAWLRNHVAGHEAVEEILYAVTETARVIDRPHNRTTFAIGPCPEPGCPGEVRVFIPAHDDRPAHMSCAACGARWESVQFLNAGKRIRAAEERSIAPYIDSAAAAVALGVSIRTVQRWIVEGRLKNHGTPGRVLLDLDQIEALTVVEVEVLA